MKKIIRLTESDLTRIVRRVIMEEKSSDIYTRFKNNLLNEDFKSLLTNMQNETNSLVSSLVGKTVDLGGSLAGYKDTIETVNITSQLQSGGLSIQIKTKQYGVTIEFMIGVYIDPKNPNVTQVGINVTGNQSQLDPTPQNIASVIEKISTKKIKYNFPNSVDFLNTLSQGLTNLIAKYKTGGVATK